MGGGGYLENRTCDLNEGREGVGGRCREGVVQARCSARESAPRWAALGTLAVQPGRHVARLQEAEGVRR